MSPVLAGFAGILVFASAWELAGWRAPAGLARATRRVRLPRRLRPAQGAGAAGGVVAFVLIAPVAPGRLLPPLAIALVAAGLMAPNALADRRAAQRRSRLIAALPEALDLFAVGAAAGRSPRSLFAEVASGSRGPLAEELGMVVADIDGGIAQGAALADLRSRVAAPELGALAAAIERSRLYGSPLADQLHAQAIALRRAQRRRIEERAARAAPKIQLVIALVLVPSALLTIAAALVAHSDALFGAL